ncbi:gap junction beta-7 protein-like [Engraulis encrasicolus]|uniref:gap junction beta-7 protein-like n=1 Tax=Engraulis encrasicolus TaxID=184585 RepID=UPI002FD1378C
MTFVCFKHEYSTVFGRMLLSMLIVFRVLVFVVAAQSVWGDEEDGFKCNTAQPGCRNVCYDYFFPISHICLYALQLICVTCLLLLVVGHVKWREQKDLRDTTSHHRHLYPGKRCGSLCITYLLSLILMAGSDVGFLYVLYHVYDGYDIPKVIQCQVSPCPGKVDCFIYRPTEKKIFTLFMVVSACVCLVVCLCEMACLFGKKIMHFMCTVRRLGELVPTTSSQYHDHSSSNSEMLQEQQWDDPTLNQALDQAFGPTISMQNTIECSIQYHGESSETPVGCPNAQQQTPTP